MNQILEYKNQIDFLKSSSQNQENKVSYLDESLSHLNSDIIQKSAEIEQLTQQMQSLHNANDGLIQKFKVVEHSKMEAERTGKRYYEELKACK